jgi:pyrroloquinoline quinone biosynthesis protein E
MLPCQNAHTLPLHFENVRDRSVGEIWETSEAFNAFRGEAWMREPCRDCDRRAVDYGGCRCQAFHLTGDPANADPACGLSADHGLITGARGKGLVSDAGAAPLIYRRLPTVT